MGLSVEGCYGLLRFKSRIFFRLPHYLLSLCVTTTDYFLSRREIVEFRTVYVIFLELGVRTRANYVFENQAALLGLSGEISSSLLPLTELSEFSLLR